MSKSYKHIQCLADCECTIQAFFNVINASDQLIEDWSGVYNDEAKNMGEIIGFATTCLSSKQLNRIADAMLVSLIYID